MRRVVSRAFFGCALGFVFAVVLFSGMYLVVSFAQLEFLEIGSRRWESIRGFSAAMTLIGLFVGAFLGVVDILARKEIKS